MKLEQLFNDCVQKEIDERKKEEIKKAKMYDLRCKWCEETIEKLSFLRGKGIRLEAHPDCEFPFVAIKPSNGWAFIDITSEHVWKEEDLNDETFYVNSNTGSFPAKSRVGWNSILETIAKWI